MTRRWMTGGASRAPHRLLAVDAGGALLSALCLGFLLPAVGEQVGMPAAQLRLLALLAVGLVALSTACALVAAIAPRPALATVGFADALDGGFTLASLAKWREQLQWLDALYFFGELAIVAILIALEIGAARRSASSA